MDPNLLKLIVNQLSDKSIDSQELARIREQMAQDPGLRDAVEEVLGAIVDKNLERQEIYLQDKLKQPGHGDVIVQPAVAVSESSVRRTVREGASGYFSRTQVGGFWRDGVAYLKRNSLVPVLILSAAVLTSGIVSNSWTRSSYAHENSQLRHVLDEQRLVRSHIANLLKAVAFVNDDVAQDRPGPSFMVSGRDGLTVAGIANPELIEKVDVYWDLDQAGAEPEEIFRRRQSRAEMLRSQAAVPFEGRHVYHLRPGQKVRVRAVATGVESERATLTAMRRDETWCTRQATFLMTDYGLHPLTSPDWLESSIRPEQVVDQDVVLLKGPVYERGWLVSLLRTVNDEYFWLDKPVAVDSGKPLLRELDFGDCPDGRGVIQFLLLENLPSDWERITCANFAVPLRELPAVKHRLEIPVTVKLPPTAVRIGRFVKENNGTLQLHGEQKVVADPERIQKDVLIQSINLNSSRIDSIRRLRGASVLQGLMLNETLVTDEGVEGLGRLGPKLRWLGLGGTRITDRALSNHAPVLGSLESLLLHKNRSITNLSLETLAGAYRELRTLDISDTGISSVRPLANLSKLSWLRIHGLTVPAGEIEELKRMLPDLKVITE